MSARPPPPADAALAAPALAAAPSVTITNGLVTARVLTPDADKGFYRGTRFDWSGAIASLTYKDREFYGPWFTKTAASVQDFTYDGEDIIAGLNTMMTGPADEFDTSGPLGWDTARVGGVVIKIGVGALRKADAEYSKFHPLEIVDPGQRTIRVGPDTVTFTQDLDAGGYAYRYEKTLTLPEGAGRLVIEHRLRNLGEQAFTTSVYNHNFLTFGGGGIGDGLSIEAPFQIATTRTPAPEAAVIRGARFEYLKPLVGRDQVSAPLTGFGDQASDNHIRIADTRRGMAVTFKGDRPLTRVELWSIRSVVSFEPFVTLTVAPGQEVRWSYVYDYEAP